MEAAKTKAEAQLMLAKAKLNDSGEARFNREKQLKVLEAAEQEKAHFHETKINLSTQTLNHWKANYNRILALKEYGIQSSAADLEFLRSKPPDPKAILLIPPQKESDM